MRETVQMFPRKGLLQYNLRCRILSKCRVFIQKRLSGQNRRELRTPYCALTPFEGKEPPGTKLSGGVTPPTGLEPVTFEYQMVLSTDLTARRTTTVLQRIDVLPRSTIYQLPATTKTWTISETTLFRAGKPQICNSASPPAASPTACSISIFMLNLANCQLQERSGHLFLALLAVLFQMNPADRFARVA